MTEGSPRALKQHVDSISAKNHQLEVALRQETLANEEQRNYIQILKNVIEQKLERDGLLELLKETNRRKRAEDAKQAVISKRSGSSSPNERAKEDEEAINLYIVLSDIKHQLDSKSKEVSRYIESLKMQDEQTKQLLQENQRYQEELMKVNQELNQVKSSYANFENEVGVLHKQKEDLLDCVEGQVN